MASQARYMGIPTEFCSGSNLPIERLEGRVVACLFSSMPLLLNGIQEADSFSSFTSQVLTRKVNGS